MKKFNKDKYLRKLKLKKYLQNNSRYFYIGIPCLLCLVLGIYFAYSKFFVFSEEEVIRTTVGEFIYGDIIMTPYVDGQYSSTFPEKKTGINVEKVVCDNGVTASWDEDKWGLYATNLSKRTKCSVYFVTPNSCGINDNVSCINSRDGLATLVNEVNNGDNKSGKIIYLTNDLDLGGKFDSDGNALDGNISWTPIGTDSNPFSGTFDGNGHIISNMYVNRPNGDNNGLFGWAENGLIKNIGVYKSYVIGNIGQGAIIGQKGSVKNSFGLANIKGKGRSGGICGSDCVIRNSYNGGDVVNDNVDLAAGISGGYGSAYNCYNFGNITSSRGSTAGIIGWAADIYNSYNLGRIIGSLEKNTGGILGWALNNKIVSCYNSGKINVGGSILGSQYTDQNESGINDYSKFSVYLSNNYYLTGTADYGLGSYKTNQGAEPLSEDEMPSVISVINGDNAFVEDTNNINNGYPILKWQAERENN